MDFVNPTLLGGLAAAAIPLVLHLILRQRPRHFVFPALRLLAARRQANTRRLRLRHWLLLALRMLALSLLALALARPSMQAPGLGADQEAPVAAALVFDVSVRMECRHENHTRLEQAQELATRLLTTLPAASQVAVLDSASTGAAFQVDLSAASQRLTRLRISPHAAPMTEVLTKAARLLAESPLGRKEIYVFSDFTRAGWPLAAADACRAALKELNDQGLYLIDVGVAAPRDVAWGDVQLSAQALPQSGSLVIGAELSSQGEPTSRTVELWLENAAGALEKRHQQTVEFTANASVLVEFPPVAPDVGQRQGEIRLVGEDCLVWNDRRYFTVSVSPLWKVLVAAPAPASRHARWVVEALAPDSIRKAGRARYTCDVVDAERLGDTTLTNYATVLLVDPSPLAAETWSQLAAYATRGSGLGIFLGAAAIPVAAFNEAAPQELLPAPLLQQARRPDDDVFLAPRTGPHPLWHKFEQLVDGVPWDAFAVHRYWQLGSVAERGVILASFSDGEPALVESRLGTGRVVTMTTSVAHQPGESAWNQLPTGLDAWPFVMLINELTQYLIGTSDAVLNVTPGQQVMLSKARDADWNQYLVIDPDGQSQRRAAEPGQPRLMISPGEKIGNYRVRAGGGETRLDAGFSVNLPAEATRLERLPETDLASLFDDLPYRIAHNREELDRDVSLGRVGRELFPWLMVAIVGLLAAEQWVANRFYRDDSSSLAPPASESARAAA